MRWGVAGGLLAPKPPLLVGVRVYQDGELSLEVPVDRGMPDLFRPGTAFRPTVAEP